MSATITPVRRASISSPLDGEQPAGRDGGRAAFYHMPYYWAEMRLEQRTRTRIRVLQPQAVCQPSRSSSRRAIAGLGPTRKLAESRSGTLEYFLTERYCLFTRNHRGRTGAGQCAPCAVAARRCRSGDRAQRSARCDRNSASGSGAGAALLAPPGGVHVAPELAAPARRRQRIPAQAMPSA